MPSLTTAKRCNISDFFRLEWQVRAKQPISPKIWAELPQYS